MIARWYLKYYNSVMLNRYYILATLILPVTNILIRVFNGESIFFENCTMFFLASIILAAIGEEIVFRVFLQNLLIQRFRKNPLKSIILVNILFGMLHFVNIFSYASISYFIIQFFCAFSIGIFYSLVYYYQKSIVLCAISHSLVNITSGCLEKTISLSSFEAYFYCLVCLAYLVIDYKLSLNILGDE